MKRLNTRILDYVALVQDNILMIDKVPADIKEDVTYWIRYFSGIKDEEVKDVSHNE